MKKATIGLTPSHDTGTDDISMRPTYLRAIAAAGGIPLVLPLEVAGEDLAQLADCLDGFLFTGGPDVHPFLFGEQTQVHCGNVSVLRDTLELNLLPLVMKARKPILGICRGVQTINIALGGDIYQDIPSQFKEDFPIAHQQPFSFRIPSHNVDVAEDTLLRRIAQAPCIQVNSMHHQAVRRIGHGLIPSGYGPNGLVEAVELPGYPFLLGVQWHPEYLYEADSAAARIFEEFVRASQAQGFVKP